MTLEFATIEETATILGVSTRHVRRLADSGVLTRIARGLIDRSSLDRYLLSRRQGRTRAWTAPTAWGAVAILSGQGASWLGPTQSARLRSALREMTDVDDLLTRMRERSRVRVFVAHRAALPRLRVLITSSEMRLLGVTAAVDGSVDGYLPAADLDAVVRTHGLREDAHGTVVLRATGFDFDRVRTLVATRTVAALDGATASDPRLRGVGRRALGELLEEYG